MKATARVYSTCPACGWSLLKGGKYRSIVGIYRRCPECMRNFPAFDWNGSHERTHCKPCMRKLGMKIDGEDE